MGLLECASSNSVYRGYDYYNCDKVISFQNISDGVYNGIVEGSNGKLYEVYIDTNHPRKSHCNCPHAEGKRIVCKHQVALFFNAFPEKAKEYKKELDSYYDYMEKQKEDEEEALIKFIHKCKKSELEDILYSLLMDSPEWLYDRFIREYLG